jgi:hypothetical protein
VDGTVSSVVLAAPAWAPRRDAHAARVDALVAAHLERRRRRERHPVEDFLFTYYSFRPAALRRWHPGYGVGLADGDEYAEVRGYTVAGGVASVAVETLERRQRQLELTHRLLAATRDRPAHFGCFGLHEWAMVYHQPPEAVRHAAWPLRLGPGGTDAVVDAHRISCSHFDAFRFFTPDARPLNALQPRRDNRVDLEQPACLHAGMDLYRHAYRLTPLLPAELVADCFVLARDIRVLDMRASPYDLAALGHPPVRVETAEGKQEYVAAQRGFAARAAGLRGRLLAETARLLGVAQR